MKYFLVLVGYYLVFVFLGRFIYSSPPVHNPIGLYILSKDLQIVGYMVRKSWRTNGLVDLFHKILKLALVGLQLTRLIMLVGYLLITFRKCLEKG